MTEPAEVTAAREWANRAETLRQSDVYLSPRDFGVLEGAKYVTALLAAFDAVVEERDKMSGAIDHAFELMNAYAKDPFDGDSRASTDANGVLAHVYAFLAQPKSGEPTP